MQHFRIPYDAVIIYNLEKSCQYFCEFHCIFYIYHTFAFTSDGKLDKEEKERIEQLESNLMLFFTGITRTAATVAETYVSDINSRERQLTRIYDMVDEAVALLKSATDLDEFGYLLHKTWVEKSNFLAVKEESYDKDGEKLKYNTVMRVKLLLLLLLGKVRPPIPP